MVAPKRLHRCVVCVTDDRADVDNSETGYHGLVAVLGVGGYEWRRNKQEQPADQVTAR